MKKSAAIFMAAFYLLLITGGYACIISCGSNDLMEFVTSNDSSNDHSHNGKEKHSEAKSEKHCDGDEDCSCCKKHGNYSVKENIKPDTNFQILELPAIAINYRFGTFSTIYSFQPTANEWPKNHAPPPPGTSAPIFIKLHSLLI
ncbi:hypothetical protein [Daejeonella sp. JGW-45]|uniref:hypothetical protein n=1 Tax=Daejeonella sp. JGW-45 TaxID=3034148 RepID=UPI0023ED516D|nr:hypothetical protein [Daejeonella sp. JGW-45]